MADNIISQEDVIKEPRELKLPEKDVELFQIIDTIQVVDSVPTGKPTSFTNQFKIYNNAGTRRFYWYDTLNSEWVYVAGTV